jgi:hypothetical protein
MIRRLAPLTIENDDTKNEIRGVNPTYETTIPRPFVPVPITQTSRRVGIQRPRRIEGVQTLEITILLKNIRIDDNKSGNQKELLLQVYLSHNASVEPTALVLKTDIDRGSGRAHCTFLTNKEIPQEAMLNAYVFASSRTDDGISRVRTFRGYATASIIKLCRDHRVDNIPFVFGSDSTSSIGTASFSIKNAPVRSPEFLLTPSDQETTRRLFEEIVVKYKKDRDAWTSVKTSVVSFSDAQQAPVNELLVNVPSLQTKCPILFYFMYLQKNKEMIDRKQMTGFMENIFDIVLKLHSIKFENFKGLDRTAKLTLLAKFLMFVPSVMGYTTDEYGDNFSYFTSTPKKGESQLDCEDMAQYIGLLFSFLRDTNSVRLRYLKSVAASRKLMHVLLTSNSKNKEPTYHIVSLLVDEAWLKFVTMESGDEKTVVNWHPILLEPLYNIQPYALHQDPIGSESHEDGIPSIFKPYILQSDAATLMYRDVVSCYLVETDKTMAYVPIRGKEIGCRMTDLLEGLKDTDIFLIDPIPLKQTAMQIIRKRFEELSLVHSIGFDEHKKNLHVLDIPTPKHTAPESNITVLFAAGEKPSKTELNANLTQAIDRFNTESRRKKDAQHTLRFAILPQQLYVCETFNIHMVNVTCEPRNSM